jgi:hypothetical protein
LLKIIIMNKIIKTVLLVLGILVVLVIGAAIILPIIYKSKIVEYAKSEANKRMNAKLDFDNNISLSLFKSFPDFSLGVDHIRIINKAPFEGDTLVDIAGFKTTLDLMSVLRGGKIEVKSITLDKPYINLRVMEDGTSNWDIAIKNKDTLKKEGKDTTSNFKMSLKKYAINQGKIIYDDKSNGFYLRLDSLNHTGTGDFTADVFDLNTHSTAKAMTVGYGGINYLYNVKTAIDAILNINMKESKYTFKDNNIDLNDLNLNLDGFVAMPGDDIDMNLKLNSKKTDFKNILSLVPGIYKKDFKDLKSSGQMAFNGDVKGVYNSRTYPGFHVNLQVSNGMFQYPGLPGAVTNVNVNTNVSNPGGALNNTVIDIKKLHAELGGESLDAYMNIKTPMTDPYLDGALKTKLTLDKIKNFIKLENTQLSGLVDADLKMKGSLSAAQKKDFDKFNASGYIIGQNIGYTSTSFSQPVKISTARLDFNPKDVKLSNLAMTIGQSDLKADGNLENLLGYVLKDQIITGNMNITSNYFDVNQLMPKSETKKESTASSSKISAPDIPANINFVLKSSIKKLIYDTYNIEDFVGLITIKDKRVTFDNISMKMLNASFAMKGYYDSKNAKKPVTEVNLDVKQLSIPAAFNQFVTIQKFAPIAKYVTGLMSGSISLNSVLGQDLMPDWNTLISNGILDIPKANISGFMPLNELADKLKMPNLKNLELTGIKPSYNVTNGRFYLKNPVQFSVGDAKFNIIGSSGLDRSMDYVMQVEMPAKQLQSQANSLIDQALKQKGLNVLPDQNVKANVLITGTIDKPVIKISMKDLATGTANALKDRAKEEFDKQKQELQKKAQEQLDQQKQKLMQEEQKQKDELNKKVEAEKKKQQDQLNKQVEQQKKTLEEQGKNKLKDIFKK